ncbi:hypothetical protein BKA70DRAFT_1556399 [Coprinopsis sp. MPI-PUGE-AT-0042]|nr:hypothetical protein BKA70DRAFT_1556399 [Coprinopsis sp. MPI-PUGE-AT-0042]
MMASDTLQFVPPSTKRHRTSSDSSGAASDSGGLANAFKSTRLSPEASPGADGSGVGVHGHRGLICTLPPTCNRKPTPLANSKELESHYSKYHAHVCEDSGCGCVFPEPRLLELHQTECHDPLAALRRERGEKIFACHLTSCPKSFATPKGRRLHLISAHGYPKEYFFGVTNKGVGGLLKKWGEGASMIRGKWKERDDDKGKGKQKSAIHSDPKAYRDAMDVDEDDSSGSDGSGDEDDEDATTTSGQQSRPSSKNVQSNRDTRMVLDPDATPRIPVSSTLPVVSSTVPLASDKDAADVLAAGFSSLSLVPPSVRFGRGGKSSGFSSTRSASAPAPVASPPPAPPAPAQAAPASPAYRGRGGPPTRGRGRGGFHAGDNTQMQVDGAPDGGARGRGRGRGGRGGFMPRGRGA